MKRFFSAVLVLCVCLSLIIMPGSAEEQQTQIDTIRIAIQKEMGTFAPFNSSPNKSWDILSLVYDNLYEMDTHRVLQPSLATSYEISEDYTTYTFYLRDDVTWHDGEDFTSADVKFTLEMAANTVNSVNFTGPAKTIQEIATPDDYTVAITFQQPTSEVIMDTLFGYMPIVPEHLYAGLTEDEISTNPDLSVGTGPYKLVDFDVTSYYEFEANDDYFGGTPVAKTIIMPIIEDKTANFTALKSHQVDASSVALTSEIVSQFQSDPTLEVIPGVGYASKLLFLNESRAPFNDKEFRQALSKSLDIQTIMDTVLLGQGTVASPGFVSPNDKLYNPETPAHVYDAEGAEAQLEAAGYLDQDGDGFREDLEGNPMQLDLLVYSSNSVSIRACEMIVEYMGEVGINVNLRVLESGLLDSLVAPNWDGVEDGDYDMCLWGWGDQFMTTPSRYVEQFHSDPTYGPSNLTRIKEPKCDAIMERIRDSLSLEEIYAAVDDMQIYLADHVTMVPLYFEDTSYAFDPSVYDGWKATDGRGIVNKRSLVYLDNVGTDDEAVTQEPAGDVSTPQPDQQPADSAQANNTGLLVLGCAVVVIVAAGVIFSTRKKKKNG